MIASIDNVSFAYQANPDTASDHVAGVSGISLEFPEGSCTLITGASGSGKSTVLKLLNGLVPALYPGQYSGRVIVAGRDTVTTGIQELGRCAGMVFQNPRSQFFTRTVLEELAFASENAGDSSATIAENVADALNVWGIERFIDRKTTELSGGELQGVACAAASAGPQKVLLLDEPTSNLSPTAIEIFMNSIRRLKSEGWTLVIAEHRVYPFRDLADRVITMRDGHVASELSGEEFFALGDDRRRSLGLRTLVKPEWRHPRGVTGHDGVQARDVRFSYGKRPVLRIPEFEAPSGSVVALTGENGVGKSTLARVLIGLAKPEKAASISFCGKTCTPTERQKRSALVMQDVNRQLFAESVAGEVALGNDVTAERVDELLSAMDLEGLADRHPTTLSGGQKQRLVIANALASDAQLYVFDEPTSGVDYRHLEAMTSQIRNLATQGKSVVVISHDLEFINEVADQQACLCPADGGSHITWVGENGGVVDADGK